MKSLDEIWTEIEVGSRMYCNGYHSVAAGCEDTDKGKHTVFGYEALAKLVKEAIEKARNGQ